MKKLIFSLLAAGGCLLAIGAEGDDTQADQLPAVTPPFIEDFSDGVEALNKMTVIDANADGKTWTVMGMQAKIAQNSKLAMDDWMITRGLNLEAGKAYAFSIAGCNSNGASYVEKFEVKLGKANTVEAMTQEILPVTQINSKTMTTFSAYFSVETSGVYYVGVHGCSDKNKRTLYLDDIKVSAPMDGNLPSAVTDAKAVPAADGSKKAEISFKAPLKNLIGGELTSIARIEVVRDGETVVKTFTAPAPGAELNFTDEVGTGGNHSWTIKPYGAVEGDCPEVSVSAYLGFTKPNPVTNVTVKETAAGEVEITWEAPETDLNGLALPASALTYKLQDVSGSTPVVLEAEMTGTSYKYQAVEEGSQAFKSYQINASTEGGLSSAVITAPQAVGTPDELTYFESFAGTRMSHILMYKTVSGSATWSMFSSSAQTPADGDDGLYGMTARNLNDAATAYTGKIDLGDAANPTISFYTFNFNTTGDDINTIKVEAVTADGTTVIAEKSVVDFCSTANEWNRVELSLEAVKGKTVQIAFTAVANKYAYTLLDAIKVYDKVDNNLTLETVTVPAKAKTGEEFEISAIIRNNGTEAAEDYKVELYRDEELIKSIAGPKIDPDKVDTVMISEKLSVLDKAEPEYYVSVNFAADRIKKDNTVEPTVLNHQLPSFPTPTEFEGEATAEGAPLLKWTAPVTEGVINDPVTDDFESYTSFANYNVGDWLFVDMDKGTIGGSGSNVFPGCERGTQQSFFVLDSTLEGLNGSYAAHSGNKCLINMYITSGDKKVDDWLISPELCGEAQKVTFWAKSYQQSNAETFEILYSTTGRETTDFVLLETKENIIFPWTEYSFDLPKGAKYFAIRVISVDKYFIMLDDFTYTPAGFAQLDLQGYNLYRNGVCVNEEPVTATEFTDSQAEKAVHKYRLTAVYKQGESRATDEITVDNTSGVEDVAIEGVPVSVVNGVIVFGCDLEDVLVSDTAGRVVYSGKAAAGNSLRVVTGIYLVRAEGKTYRLMVK